MIGRIAFWTGGFCLALLLVHPASLFVLVYAFLMGLLTAAGIVYEIERGR